MAETTLPPFAMQGARDALSRGFANIEQQVVAIEQAVQENPGLAFDLSRALIESVCRTILSDRSISYTTDQDLPQLYREVMRHLPLLPVTESQATDVRQSLKQTLNGLHTSIQGICELRNRCGFASHGRSDSPPALDWIQAWMVAEAADTLVGFLYRVHKQDRTSTPPTATSYHANPDFNESIDQSHGTLRILDAEFRPSEVLFEMEPETYRVHLAEFDDRDQP